MVTLKYLSNFWRILAMLLIKFEISLDRALGLKSAVIILLFLLKVSLSK